jgi:hypothetical protein
LAHAAGENASHLIELQDDLGMNAMHVSARGTALEREGGEAMSDGRARVDACMPRDSRQWSVAVGSIPIASFFMELAPRSATLRTGGLGQNCLHLVCKENNVEVKFPTRASAAWVMP